MNVPMYHAMLRHRVTNFIVSNHWTDDECNVLGFQGPAHGPGGPRRSLRAAGPGGQGGRDPIRRGDADQDQPEDFAELGDVQNRIINHETH